MKLRKHLNLKSEKVLLVLFALLFATTSLQTLAIVKSYKNNNINTNQSAQVIGKYPSTSSTLPYNNCVTVLDHKYNQIFSSPLEPVNLNPNGNTNDTDYTYEVYFNVKNNCDRPISIIDPSSMSSLYKGNPGFYTINSFALELNSLPSPTDISLAPPASSFVDAAREEGDCVNCAPTDLAFRVSPAGTLNYQGNDTNLRMYNIPAGQTRIVSFVLQIGRPYPTFGISHFLRAKLKSFKWTYTNSYISGGIVSADEIFTTTLSASQQQSFATDFANIYQDGNPNCSSGGTLGINSDGVPVCQ